MLANIRLKRVAEAANERASAMYEMILMMGIIRFYALSYFMIFRCEKGRPFFIYFFSNSNVKSY